MPAFLESILSNSRRSSFFSFFYRRSKTTSTHWYFGSLHGFCRETTRFFVSPSDLKHLSPPVSPSPPQSSESKADSSPFRPFIVRSIVHSSSLPSPIDNERGRIVFSFFFFFFLGRPKTSHCRERGNKTNFAKEVLEKRWYCRSRPRNGRLAFDNEAYHRALDEGWRARALLFSSAGSRALESRRIEVREWSKKRTTGSSPPVLGDNAFDHCNA